MELVNTRTQALLYQYLRFRGENFPHTTNILLDKVFRSLAIFFDHKIHPITMKFILSLIFIGMQVTLNAQNLIPYNKNGKYGLSDTKGNLKVEPQYTYISFYKEKLKGYSIENNGRFGLMSKNLQIVIPLTADQPIFDNGEHFIAKVGRELIYFDSNYKEVKRQQLDTSEQKNGLVYPADYPPQLGYSREEVLSLFKEQYGTKYTSEHLNIVVANNTYFIIESLAEGKRKIEGLFLPKTKAFLLNNDQTNYRSAVWVPSKNDYYISITDTANHKGVMTQDGKTIFELKDYPYLAVMPNYIAYTEPGDTSGKIAFYYIISTGKPLKNEFSYFRYFTSILDDGKPFEVFSSTVNNPRLQKGEQVFIGENGTKYYEFDFIK